MDIYGYTYTYIFEADSEDTAALYQKYLCSSIYWP